MAAEKITVDPPTLNEKETDPLLGCTVKTSYALEVLSLCPVKKTGHSGHWEPTHNH